MALSKTTEEDVEMQEEVILDIAEESKIPPESFRKIVPSRMKEVKEDAGL